MSRAARERLAIAWGTRGALLVLFAFAVSACEGEKPKKKDKGDEAPSAPAAAASAAPVPVKTGPEYSEGDFVENDRNRDPFRSYITLFSEANKKTFESTRKVYLSQYGLDELKLVAIVQAKDFPRAMVIDPHGKGWVIKRGDFIGRAETVHTGGSNGTDYQVNWRVSKVRDGDIVLVREDPAQPNIAPATRVIPLHPEKTEDQTTDQL
jgi:type IV pilus assembly protein PilP